ncbi:MAG: hypothetical protein U0R66_00415 [Mycobacterium sp.]
MTTTTASARFTATIASAMIAAGILAGAAVSQTHTQNLADYGAAITADNSTGTARSEGVPHMSDHQTGSGNYFEQMNGGAN